MNDEDRSDYDLLMIVRKALPYSSQRPKVHDAFDAINEPHPAQGDQ